jgi:hypothetical protein
MIDRFQTYKVTVEFEFEAEVFPEDPDDVFQLAALEEKSVATELSISFPSIDIKELSVAPVIGE